MYIVKPMNNNRGEKNSPRLYAHVAYYEYFNNKDISFCDTAVDAKSKVIIAMHHGIA
jgi:hypothetical protein